MDENKCGFCHTGAENESVCGTLHRDTHDGKVICAHHKCMQYSACLVQYKTDSFGGFKKPEVSKEIKRGSRLICALCKNDKSKKNKKGATSGCAWASCRKTFHYLCVSMNPRTVAKRYRVAAGDKVVILYRVFCCADHEKRYRENLSAEDIVGQNLSSDEEQEKDDADENESNSDTDVEPPAKKSKISKTKDEAESGMSSPGMTAEEIVSETRRQVTILQKKNGASALKHENGEDSLLTGTSGQESGGEVTEDFNTSNSPNESDYRANKHGIRNIDNGFHIIIPSILEVPDFKSLCEKVGFSEDSCLLWPQGYCKKGLQDKHMPFLMWNLADKLSKNDYEGLVRCLNAVSPDQYECLCSLHDDLKSTDDMESKLNNLSNKINRKYKTEVCRVMQASVNDENFFCMLFSLPKVMLEECDVWSLVNVHVWSRDTVVPTRSRKQVNPSLEKKILLKWLLPRLRNKSCEITAYPAEETLRLDHQRHKFLSVAREIEFRLETMSQSSLSESLVKVQILRKVNREAVNFRTYLQVLLEQFFSNNAGYECYCIVHVLQSDGIRDLEDVLPHEKRNLIGRKVHIFSAFNPRYGPVSCLIVYAASSDATGGLGDFQQEEEETPQFEESESFNLYLDMAETPVET